VQVAGHRREEDGEGVVQHAVPDGLGDGERGDDAQAVAGTRLTAAPGVGGGGPERGAHPGAPERESRCTTSFLAAVA
jgi:hypothetical protein